jgi:hypothetical protein
MSHPNNLSDEYPCQGDTWAISPSVYNFTVVLVTPNGKIRYVDNIHLGNRRVKETDLDGFKAFNLGKPFMGTYEFIEQFGVTVSE